VNPKEGKDVTVEEKWKMIAKEKLPALLPSVKEMGTYFYFRIEVSQSRLNFLWQFLQQQFLIENACANRGSICFPAL
jgi:hypothetical protein